MRLLQEQPRGQAAPQQSHETCPVPPTHVAVTAGAPGEQASWVVLGAGSRALSPQLDGGRTRFLMQSTNVGKREGRGHALETVPRMTTAGAPPPRAAPSQAGPSCGIIRLHAQVTPLLTGQHRERRTEQAHPPQAQVGVLVVVVGGHSGTRD